MEIIPNWHPIFVHFTVALLSVSVGLHVVRFFIKDGDIKTQCHTVAQWNLWLGTAFTIATVLTGWYAYNTVAHDEPSHLAMTDHRNWALLTASVFIILTAWSIWQYRKNNTVNYALVISLVVASLLLGSTAWRGGEVVYRYGVGVMSLPDIDAAAEDGHDHEHNVSEEKVIENDSIKSNLEMQDPKTDDGHDGHAHDH